MTLTIRVLLRFLARLAALSLPLTGFFSESSLADDHPIEDLDALVKTLQSYEALYENCEVHYQLSYKLLDDYGSREGTFKSSITNYEVVKQNGLSYSSLDESGNDVFGRNVGTRSVNGFDGAKSRTVRPTVAHISDSRYANAWTDFLNPYMLPLSRHKVTLPLSIYLRGTEGVKSSARYRDLNSTTSILGYETVEGVPCIKLKVYLWRDDYRKNEQGFSLLWLARDMNYLPVRWEEFNTKAMPHPIFESLSSDFREVDPGIWCPFETTIKWLSPIVFRDTKRLSPKNVHSYRLTYIRFNPNRDISLFRDVPIPDGTVVYVVKDKSIVTSYIQGRRSLSPRRRTTYVALLTIPVASLAILTIMIWRRRTAGIMKKRLQEE